MSADRDAEVVRRARRAGLATWAGAGGGLAVWSALAGGGGRTGLVAVTVGLLLGAVVCAGWLLLAGILDLLADQRPGRRRLLWTAGAVLLVLVSPMLVLGAAGA